LQTRRKAHGRPFNELITDNRAVFRHYFGVDLFPGSAEPASLQRDLDAGRPPPAFVIPKGELINMPRYIGDGQAWPCRLRGKKFPAPVGYSGASAPACRPASLRWLRRTSSATPTAFSTGTR
jgi:hypothetical protein